MPRKQDQAAKRNTKPDIPSTGQGAASALDAMIKRRVVAPGEGKLPLPLPLSPSRKH